MAAKVFILAFLVLFYETQSQLLSCGGPGPCAGPIGPLPPGPPCPLSEAQSCPRNLPGPINEFLLNSLNRPSNLPFGPFPGTFGNGPFNNIQDCSLNVPVESPCYGQFNIEDAQLNAPCRPLSEPVCVNSLGINRDLRLNNLVVNELTGPCNTPVGPCGTFNRPFNGPLSLEYINSLESVPVCNVPQVETCECVQDALNPFGGPLRPNFNCVSPIKRPNCLLPQTLSENLLSNALNRPCGSQRETIIENLQTFDPGCRPCGLVTESVIDNIPVVNNIATSFNQPCGFVPENSIDLATINSFSSPYSKPCGPKFENVPTVNPFGPFNRPCDLPEHLIENGPIVTPLIGNRPCGPKIETVIENVPTINPFTSPFNRPCGLSEPLIENVPTVNPVIGPYNRPCGPKIGTVIENIPAVNPFASPFNRPCGLPEPLIENVPIVNPLIGNRPCGPKIETVTENFPTINPFKRPFNRPCGFPEPLIENVPIVNPLIGPCNRPCGTNIESAIENIPTVNPFTSPCNRPCGLLEPLIENVPIVNPLIGNIPCGPNIETVIENFPTIKPFTNPFNRPCGLPEPLIENVPIVNPLIGNRSCGPKIELVIENFQTINPFTSPFNRPCGLPEPLIDNVPIVNPLLGPYNRPCGPKIETVIENVPKVNSLSNRLTGCFRPLSEQVSENVPLNQLNPINNPCLRPTFNSLNLLNEPCVSLPKPCNNIPTLTPLGPISESCSSIPRPLPKFNAPVLETRSYSPINPLPSITCTPPSIPLTSTITPSIVNSSPLISSSLTDNSLTASLANSLQLLLYTNLLESYNEAVNENIVDTAYFSPVPDLDCFAPNIVPCETVETIVPNPYGGFTDIVTTVNADPYNVRPNLCGGVRDLNPLSPELIGLAELGAVSPNMLRIAERVSPLSQNLLADAIRQQNGVKVTEFLDPIQNSFGVPCTNALQQNNFNNLGPFELINLISQNQIGVPDLLTLLLQKECRPPCDQYSPPFDIPGVNPPNVFGLPEEPVVLPPLLPIEAPQNPYAIPELVALSPIEPIYPPPFYYGYESPPFNPIPSPPPIPTTPIFGYSDSYIPCSLEYNPFTSIVAEDVSSSLQNYYAEVVSPMTEILIPEIPVQLVCSFDCSALPGVTLGV